MKDADWETLVRNQADPYFTAALMNACPPATLASVAQDLTQTFTRNGNQALFQQRLEALGGALGTASRSGLLDSGYAGMVVDVLQQFGAAPAALSAVLSYAMCDPGFAQTIAVQVYDYETGTDFPGTWSQGVAQGTWFTMPDGSKRTDVMAGVLAMLGHCPQAAQAFFTQGGSSTISIDGYEVTVNDRMKYLIASRTWATGRGSDEGTGLSQALEAAVAYSEKGKIVASQACAIADVTERNHRGWHLSVNMTDSFARLMAINPELGRGYLSVDQILDQYQVVDDTVLYNWKAVWPVSEFMKALPQLTQTEADHINNMALWDPLWLTHLKAFSDDHDSAFSEADTRFPPSENGNVKDDNHNDAFRHAYWNALMTSNNGELLVIDKNGDLAWSDQVPHGQCVDPANVTGIELPGRPRDDFDVKTES